MLHLVDVDVLATSRASYILGDHPQPPNRVFIIFYLYLGWNLVMLPNLAPKARVEVLLPLQPLEYGRQQAHVTLPSNDGFLTGWCGVLVWFKLTLN